MSVHEKVNRSVEDAKTKIKSMIKKGVEAVIPKDEIKEKMTETNLLLKDSRYDIMQKFLTDYKRGLRNELEYLSTMDNVHQTTTSRIGGKIEVLKDLLERPQNIVEEYKKLNLEENDDDTESMGT